MLINQSTISIIHQPSKSRPAEYPHQQATKNHLKKTILLINKPSSSVISHHNIHTSNITFSEDRKTGHLALQHLHHSYYNVQLFIPAVHHLSHLVPELGILTCICVFFFVFVHVPLCHFVIVTCICICAGSFCHLGMYLYLYLCMFHFVILSS